MSDQQHLHAIYHDLPGETGNPGDQATLNIVADLDTICSTVPVPAHMNWNTLRMLHYKQTQQEQTHRAASLPWWRSLTTKAVLIPVIAAIFLGTSAFAFASTPLLQDVFQGLSSTPITSPNNSVYNNLGDIHLSQKIGNATVTLEKGYSDSNNIVLGVTATSVDENATLNALSLTTQSGQDLNRSGHILDDFQGNELATAMYFDHVTIAGNPQALNLTLKVSLSENGGSKTLGQATFNFKLPYHQGEIIAPNLKATSNGKTLTLEKATINKTGTDIVVSGLNVTPPSHMSNGEHAPDPKLQGNFPAASLQVAGSSQSYNFDSATSVPGSHTYTFAYDNNFSQHQGTWTLTITQGADKWVFHFNV